MKVCPLFGFAAIVAQNSNQDIVCPQTGCAWWNAEAEGCGIVKNLSPVQEYEGEDDYEEGPEGSGGSFRVL